ncbi:MAG: type II toxin-antitoxin system RelE/ParE family toxin [Candidatus Methanosuratus sp.]|nr:type II toxin-antitoxin system RelE/ParE family toxin [Candidatus Methanosuratincola sp.]
MFKVLVHRKARREIASLPDRERTRLLTVIKEMRSDPFVGDIKPLRPVKALFRRRIGDYRIVFTVNFEAEEVVVFDVGRRENVYENV